jgi:hypothetical protein
MVEQGQPGLYKEPKVIWRVEKGTTGLTNQLFKLYGQKKKM